MVIRHTDFKPKEEIAEEKVLPVFRKYITSQRGRKLLVDTDGYIYQFQKSRKDGNNRSVWRCRQYKRNWCRCTLYTESSVIIYSSGNHKHPPDNKRVGCMELVRDIKENAADMGKSTQQIVEEAFKTCQISNTGEALPLLKSLKRAVQRERAKLRNINKKTDQGLALDDNEKRHSPDLPSPPSGTNPICQIKSAFSVRPSEPYSPPIFQPKPSTEFNAMWNKSLYSSLQTATSLQPTQCLRTTPPLIPSYPHQLKLNPFNPSILTLNDLNPNYQPINEIQHIKHFLPSVRDTLVRDTIDSYPPSSVELSDRISNHLDHIIQHNNCHHQPERLKRQSLEHAVNAVHIALINQILSMEASCQACSSSAGDPPCSTSAMMN